MARMKADQVIARTDSTFERDRIDEEKKKRSEARRLMARPARRWKRKMERSCGRERGWWYGRRAADEPSPSKSSGEDADENRAEEDERWLLRN